MAKKIKVSKKSTTKNRSASYNTHQHEQNNFILIAGGGLLVLLLIFISMGGFSSNKISDVKNAALKKVQSTKEVSKESVIISDFAFVPEELVVKKGATVVFTNEDAIVHSATSDDGSFDTGLLAKGESGSVTFTKAGTYTYYCTPHPTMTGTITVQE